MTGARACEARAWPRRARGGSSRRATVGPVPVVVVMEVSAMRIVGLILVLLGGLALGCWGFARSAREPGAEQAQAKREPDDVLLVSPVVSGIVMVSGLLLLATSARREDPSEEPPTPRIDRTHPRPLE